MKLVHGGGGVRSCLVTTYKSTLAELLSIETEIEESISQSEIDIAQLKSASARASKAPQKTASPPATQEKWSKDSHLASQANCRPPAPPQSPIVEEPEKAVIFAVNDTVMAKWKIGDHSSDIQAGIPGNMSQPI